MTGELIPLKHLAQINERTLPDTTDPDREIRYIDIGSVGRGELIEDPERMRFGDAPSRARRLVKSGDTIISTVRTYLRAVWPVSGSVDDVVVSTGFAVLTPIDIEPRYFSWWVMSDIFIEEVVARSVGVSYPAINPSELSEIRVRRPNINEQRSIGNFLDVRTTQINSLISKKRKMFTHLEERWRELRCQKTLRGLDPVSGEGLSESWDEMKLGVLIELQRGHDLPQQHRVEGEIPVISSGGLSGSHNVAIVDGPGVVTGRYGTVGEVYYVDGPYWPLNTTLYVKDFRNNHPQWVYYLLASLPFDVDAKKSAVGGINRNVIGSLRVPRPPLDVQQAIADELKEAEELTRNVQKKLETQIQLLSERRQTLITAAVTGEMLLPGVGA